KRLGRTRGRENADRRGECTDQREAYKVAEQERDLPVGSRGGHSAGVKQVGVGATQARLRKEDASPCRRPRRVVERANRESKRNQLLRFNASSGDGLELLFSLRSGGLLFR